MVIFLVHRSNYYKLIGPLIQEALARGLEVELWTLFNSQGKADLDPTVLPPALVSPKIRVRKFQTKESLSAALHDIDAEAIFSLHTRQWYELHSTAALFVTLQHGIDTFVETDLEGLCNTDRLCLYSSYWVGWGAEYYEAITGIDKANVLKLLQEKVVLAGFPQMDNVHQLDPKFLREKYAFASDAQIVLYLPITLANIDGFWPRFFETNNLVDRIKIFWKATRKHKSFFSQYFSWLLCGWNDRKLTDAIQAFAHNNNALLVAKARKKDPIRAWVNDRADVALYDESHYPSTSLELLCIADVCIHFYSFAALESAYCEVRGITIDRPSPSVDVGEPVRMYHRLWRKTEPGSAFNTRGVNAWMTIPDAIRKLPTMRIADFQMDAETRDSYIQTYLGMNDGKASQRILDLLN